jgi:hypothetical protein
MSASFATLVAMFQETRGEVAELKVQLAASKEPVVRPKTFSNPNIPTQVSVPTPSPLPPGLAVAQSQLTHPDSASFVPTIANLRADGHLRAQAEQLVSDLTGSVSGNGHSLTNIKRGIVRSGGDLSPSVRVAWPQDYVLGTGKNLKLYYQDLNICELVSGYIATIQYELNTATARHMMTHLRNLMYDAVYHGWELCKDSYSDFNNIFTVLEHSIDFNIDQLGSCDLNIIDKFSSNVDLNVNSNSNKCDLSLNFTNNAQFQVSNNVIGNIVLSSVTNPLQCVNNVNLSEPCVQSQLPFRGQQVQLASLNEVYKNPSRGQLSANNGLCILLF